MNKKLVLLLVASLIVVVTTITLVYFSAHQLRYVPYKSYSGKYESSGVVFSAEINAVNLGLESFLERQPSVSIREFVNAIIEQDIESALSKVVSAKKEANQNAVNELSGYYSKFEDIVVNTEIRYGDDMMLLLSAKYGARNVNPILTFKRINGDYLFSAIDNSSFATEIAGMWSLHSNQDNLDAGVLEFKVWLFFDRSDYIRHEVEKGFEIYVRYLKKTDDDVVAVRALLERLKSSVDGGAKFAVLDAILGPQSSNNSRVMSQFSEEDILVLNEKFKNSSLHSVLVLGEVKMVFLSTDGVFKAGDDIVLFVEKNSEGKFEIAFLGMQTFWHRLFLYSNFNNNIISGAVSLN